MRPKMEFGNFTEFIQVKHHQVAFQFEIEKKEFKRFLKPFVTDKYLTVMQWEEVIRELVEKARIMIRMETIMPRDEEARNGGEFPVDDLSCCYQFVPKQQSSVNFESLNYPFDWIVKVKIMKQTTALKLPKPDILNTSAYIPSSSTTNKSQEKPPEYTPEAVNSQDYGASKYTPTKIKIKMRTAGDDVGTSSDHPPVIRKESTTCNEISEILRSNKKRQIVEEEDQREVPSKRKLRIQKKDSLDKWISTAQVATSTPAKARKSSVKKMRVTTARTMAAVENINDEEMAKLDAFVEKSKKAEIEKERRKRELEHYEVLHCNNASTATLKRMVVDFTPRIHLLSNMNATITPSCIKYDPITLTTSNIFTESQNMFLCSQLNELPDIKNRSDCEDFLMKLVLPEFTINAFCITHSLNLSDALARINTQEERRHLFVDESLNF